MNDRRDLSPEELKAMLESGEINARREAARELEKERVARLQYLFNTIATGGNVLAAHDLNCIAMKAEGAPQEAMELIEKAVRPFKEHLAQIRQAAQGFLDVQ